MQTLLHHTNHVFTLLRDNGGWIERNDIITHVGLRAQFSNNETACAMTLDRAITQLRKAGHSIEQREESGKMFYRLQQR